MSNTIILKGFHNSIPPKFRYSKQVDWVYEVSIDSHSPIEGENQLDWNKLIGVKKEYFSPMSDSLMIAWRDIQSGKEISFYKHINNKVERNSPLFVAQTGEKLLIKFKQVGSFIHCFLIYKDFVYTDKVEFNGGYLINTWFGGQSTSPINYCFTVNRVK